MVSDPVIGDQVETSDIKPNGQIKQFIVYKLVPSIHPFADSARLLINSPPLTNLKQIDKGHSLTNTV